EPEALDARDVLTSALRRILLLEILDQRGRVVEQVAQVGVEAERDRLLRFGAAVERERGHALDPEARPAAVDADASHAVQEVEIERAAELEELIGRRGQERL